LHDGVGAVTALVEARLLDGPNLYFPRAAARVTLDATALGALDAARLRAVTAAWSLPRVRPGSPGTQERGLAVQRVVRHLVRALARSSGTARLAVRVRPGPADGQVVVAYPWRRAGRATALAEALGDLVAAAAREQPAGLPATLTAAAEQVRAAEPGRTPAAVRPRVPVVSVTGTNGKTTTTRLVAHLVMAAGLRTAWSSTDGVVADGVLVEAGDYSGPSGARQVLAVPGVQVAVLETARGGLLLRGMGVAVNDVSVVTNVSADHLGLQGIDTLDQLAEVKATITRVTRPSGWTVLNGDDPRVLAMRQGSPGRPFVFSPDPASPALREALDAGGRAVTVLDGAVTVLTPGKDPDPLVPVVDLPVALAGLSRHNLANALAATAAAVALGLSREAVTAGLRSFRADATTNPGRLNPWTVPVDGGTATLLIDMAHNEDSLEALLDVARGLAAPGARVMLGLGGAGDRGDDALLALGEIAGRRADRLRIVHKDRYLRGRTREEMGSLLRDGAASVGVHDVPEHPTELDGALALLAEAGPGDVVAVMVAVDRAALEAEVVARGGSADGPDEVRAKVLAGRGEHPREAEIAGARASSPEERAARTAAMLAAAPHDARLAAEHAAALAATGDDAGAEPLYRRALAAAGNARLTPRQRGEVAVGLAGTLRRLGRPAAALEVADALLAERPGTALGAAARALALHGLGRDTDALLALLDELARHLPADEASELRAEAAGLAGTAGPGRA
jgi:cyanophycin synthetase